MSLYSYRESQKISARDEAFDALIMAAMRKADSSNITRLRIAFPEIHDELFQRYHAPGGCLEGEQPPADEEVTDDDLSFEPV